jgi:hypothetical protein
VREEQRKSDLTKVVRIVITPIRGNLTMNDFELRANDLGDPVIVPTIAAYCFTLRALRSCL